MSEFSDLTIRGFCAKRLIRIIPLSLVSVGTFAISKLILTKLLFEMAVTIFQDGCHYASLRTWDWILST
uniref:Uncharacterized protein n=2 Tax=Anguilla anguilla TaxID=7936 RepID=A0A0E9TUI3_ANGAN